MNQLRYQNIETRGLRWAKSTKANVLSHIRQWLYFSLYFRTNVLPASAEHLCLFLELASRTCGYDHCKSILGSIKYLHSSTDREFPSNNFGLEETLQGIKRRKAGTPNRVLPIDPYILRRMFYHINIQKLPDLSLCVVS